MERVVTLLQEILDEMKAHTEILERVESAVDLVSSHTSDTEDVCIRIADEVDSLKDVVKDDVLDKLEEMKVEISEGIEALTDC